MGGSSARCCQVATLAKGKDQIRDFGETPSSPSKPKELKLQTISNFKSSYTESSKVSRQTTNAVARDGSGTFACRRLGLPAMPQKSLSAISKHLMKLQNMEHPHICKFYECYQDTRELLLIYEKADPTTLFDHVRNQGCLTEDLAADYLRQLAAALAVAHSSSLFHGRLSPSKVILAPEDPLSEEGAVVQLKICDFGQTFILKSDALQALNEGGFDSSRLEAPYSARGAPASARGAPASARGAPASARGQKLPGKGCDSLRYCLSPELANRELLEYVNAGDYPKDSQCGKNDMWALGAIIYHMLTGSAPFQDAKDKDSIANAVQDTQIDFNPRLWNNLSPDARDCVEMMLKMNPGLRINAKQLLQHPWIKIAKATFPKKRMVQLLRNLKLNVDHCEFTRFVLRIVADQMPQDGEQALTVENAFRCLDGNGDGVLSLDEVAKGLTKYLEIDEAELKGLFKSIDRDGSGTLNVTEFIAATMDQRRCLALPVLWQAFNAFDQDQSGHVTFDEIATMVKELEGRNLGKDRVDSLCAIIRTELTGVSSNQAIDFDQFVYIMLNDAPSLQQAMKKDWFRFVWNKCGIDCYEVRQIETGWQLRKGGESPRNPNSPWRKRPGKKSSKSPRMSERNSQGQTPMEAG